MITKVKKKIPDTAGVYIFRRKKTPIYIGKAANLKNRLNSYFRKNSSSKINSLLDDADAVEWHELRSETEALIEEARLIKLHRPKYNILMRDDKSYFFVEITGGDFPRIYITHQPRNLPPAHDKLRSHYIGPFTSGSSLNTTMRLLRRVFPYCICRKPHRTRCLASELGLCPGYCCIKGKSPNNFHEEKNIYKKNVQKIIKVLTGKTSRLLRALTREMTHAAKCEQFEHATMLRNEIYGVENVFSHNNLVTLTRDFASWEKIEKTIARIPGIGPDIHRVEGYDISNISGTNATGSMVVFIDGKPEKSAYRKFKIKTIRGANDFAMLQEVVRRRMSHREWKYPDIMLIDGGKPQLHAVKEVLDHMPASRIRLLALAKREEELYTGKESRPLPLKNMPSETAFFFQNVRNESHRFAKKYHHKLREMELKNQTRKHSYQ